MEEGYELASSEPDLDWAVVYSKDFDGPPIRDF